MQNLDLIRDQREKLNDLQPTLRQEREAINNDDNLTPDQKKAKPAETKAGAKR